MTRTVLRSTVRVIVILAVVLPLALALAVATDQLRTTTLLTGSMSPALPAGTFLLERPVEAGDVQAGDVITFDAPSGGELVTHRVVSTTTDEQGRVLATTKGDDNDETDAWQVVLSGGPVWTVRWHLEGVGGLTTAVRNQQGAVSVAVVVVPLLLLGVVLRDVWRHDEDDEPPAAPDDDGLGLLLEDDELVDAGARA